ncbi:MAG: hypothetical protein LBI39_03915 [Puniceicoccales bacterium]|jgi:sulfite reductase (NADPH) flavoprotein alpha-component|nr:hypothetical protein [Puniceicoccales bacterium]
MGVAYKIDCVSGPTTYAVPVDSAKKFHGHFFLKSREKLSRGEGKEVCEIILGATEPITYEPGDWLAVLPENDGDEIAKIAAAMGAKTDEQVLLHGEKISFGEALRFHLSIGDVSKDLCKLVAELGSNGDLKSAVESADVEFLATASAMGILEFLEKFSAGAELPAQDFSAALRPIRPRLYSIASCRECVGNAVRLLVATAQFVDGLGRQRFGVASSYLNRRLEVGKSLRANVITTKFRLPEDPSADVIMVGPGAGLAPFIGFLEKRELQRKSNKSVGRNWLFFGDRNIATDFIGEKRLLAWLESGLLTRLDLAFSRDQENKIYVQDRIRENGEKLLRWLNGGANFYICGDGKRMAKDVEAAIRELFIRHGNMDGAKAAERISAMARSRAYQRDVY